MEKKPNITPTPWVVKQIGVNESFIESKIKLEPIAKIYKKKNTQAIVTAVNCTYGANINPEKIQELIESLAEHQLMVQRLLARCIQRHGLDLQDSEDEKTYVRGEQALNNIKYK